MVCDAMFHITNVEAKCPGSVHDSGIFRESHLCTLFERGKGTYKCQAHSITHTYAEPKKTAFFHYTGDFDGIPLGDRGYACRQYVMTSFPDPNPGPQTRYNAALARTRARIEMTFGQLNKRSQYLRAAPDRACDIIVDMNLNNGDNKNNLIQLW